MWGILGAGRQVFEQSPTLECTVAWQQGGSISLMSGSQACVVDASAANTKMTVVGTSQLRVQVRLKFPAVMTGQLSVQAWGTDEQGQAGPPTEITKFTVTGTPVPMILFTDSVHVNTFETPGSIIY